MPKFTRMDPNEVAVGRGRAALEARQPYIHALQAGDAGKIELQRGESQFMRQLIATSSSESQMASRSTTPRVLVQFWDDASAIPDDVQECLESSAPLEAAGFERTLFDDTSARHFIEDHFGARNVRAFDRCSHPAMRADYFRLCFMLRVGGLYVDADDE